MVSFTLDLIPIPAETAWRGLAQAERSWTVKQSVLGETDY